MDNLKVYSKTSKIATQGKTNISDRLSVERAKAIEILQKSKGKTNCVSLSGAHCCKANKENVNENSRSRLDKSGYVPFRSEVNSINISDLVTDETINLERTADVVKSPRNEKPVRGESGILFEPEEMTGRSTLYNGAHKSRALSPRHGGVTKTSKDVQELLASSFMHEVRALAKSTELDTYPPAPLLTHTLLNDSSYTTTFNPTHSLPRTADMSNVSEKSTLSNCGDGGISFSFTKAAAANNNDSAFSSEEFAAAELMESKFLKDEISWAKDYAAIPTAVVSKSTTQKVASEPNMSTAFSNISLVDGDPNFSVGSYFNKRSDNIRDIVTVKSPEKFRTPHALVKAKKPNDNDTISTTTTSIDVESTPKIDNRTYSLAMPLPREDTCNTHESKDSGNCSRNSFLLSMSAIDRALNEMDINTDVSEDNVINKLKMKSKARSPLRRPMGLAKEMESKQCTQTKNEKRILHDIESIVELIAENKENLDPEAMRSAAQFSDTLSFTESLLNCTELNAMKRSSNSGNPRSPLSPIDIKIIPPSDNDTNIDADVDEWPSTPVKSPQRQVRRKKSPINHSNFKSPVSLCDGKLSPKPRVRSTIINDGKRSPSPVHGKCATTTTTVSSMQRSRTPSPSSVQQHKTTNGVACNGYYSSPDQREQPQPQQKTPISESSNSHITIKYSPFGLSDDAGDRTLTSTTNNVQKSANKKLSSTRLDNDVGKTLLNHQSPHTRNASAMSASPTSDCYRSPKMNGTQNSERRADVVNGVCCSTACSSPVNSETGASVRSYQSYGAPATRSSSTVSMNDGAVVRSTSRCSNSSEFSHRDGKTLPIKVTDIELNWGSTRLRANARKSLQVKNTSDKRLVLRISISGPGYSLLNSQSSTLAFQSQECRTITVNFSPTVIGAAVGTLSFYSPLSATNNNLPYLELPLYGYGGNVMFQLLNIAKGPVGTAFLTMGEHLAELSHPLVRTIKLHNRGPLLGFALVTIDSSGLHGPRLCDAFEVRPSQLLIKPGDTATVSITFRPKREDIKKIAKKIQAVYTLANMRVIAGDEANRQRMRRLVQRMSSEERNKLTTNSLEALWARFPGECTLGELNDFARESVAAAADLMTGVSVHEIALTLNHHESPDNTMESTVSSAFCCFPDGDETVLFRTVCVAATASPTSSVGVRGGAENKLYTVNEMHEATVSSTITTHSSSDDMHDVGGWSVSPNELAFDLFSKRRREQASLLIRNTFRSRQYFEVTTTHAGLLRFIPCEGYIQPDGGQVEIEVHALQSRPPTNLQPNETIYIDVSMENERIRVPVKLPMDNYVITNTC